MSEEKDRFESQRWLDQAGEDLKAALVLQEGERYAQACFYAQQSAEKALKALAGGEVRTCGATLCWGCLSAWATWKST